MASVYQNKRVLLGVTGGIAAYKAAELASLLVKNKLEVRVLMTDAAKQFIRPLTFSALTGNPVAEDMFNSRQEVTIGHIELARWADIMVVAPATANFLAKAACGLADDLLSTVVLATRAPFLVAPAMNPAMWSNQAVQDNAARLKSRGVEITGPAVGITACGEEGEGRMEEPGGHRRGNLPPAFAPVPVRGKGAGNGRPHQRASGSGAFHFQPFQRADGL